mmetsp:Transcript_26884/g.59077  ORF Transcript_26884/g.59077 Transcript_26884/m.59077 type:complete len:213 (-) Transcript_26884:408-1046(-)
MTAERGSAHGGRNDPGDLRRALALQLSLEIHRFGWRDELDLVDLGLERARVFREPLDQTDEVLEQVDDLHLWRRRAVLDGGVDGGLQVLLGEEDGTHLLPSPRVDKAVGDVRRDLRYSRCFHRLDHELGRSELLGGVWRELPDHLELAPRHLVAQARKGRLLHRQLEGAVEVRGQDTRTRGSRLLEDALEHLVRLAREEEHERSLVAVAPLT